MKEFMEGETVNVVFKLLNLNGPGKLSQVRCLDKISSR